MEQNICLGCFGVLRTKNILSLHKFIRPQALINILKKKYQSEITISKNNTLSKF